MTPAPMMTASAVWGTTAKGLPRSGRRLYFLPVPDESATRGIVWMRCRFVPVKHRRDAGVCFFENRSPFVARLRGKGSLELLMHTWPVVSAMLQRKELSCTKAKSCHESRKKLLLKRANGDELAIGASISPIEWRSTIEKILPASLRP